MTDVKNVTLAVPAVARLRGPADGWVGTGWEVTVHDLPLGRAWGLDKACEQAQAAFTAAYDARTEVLRWLVSLDDPEDVIGREERRTVTLTQIISRARTALDPSADPPQETAMPDPCAHGPHLLDGNDYCVCGARWSREQVIAAINAPGGEYPGQPADPTRGDQL